MTKFLGIDSKRETVDPRAGKIAGECAGWPGEPGWGNEFSSPDRYFYLIKWSDPGRVSIYMEVTTCTGIRRSLPREQRRDLRRALAAHYAQYFGAARFSN